MTHNAKDNVNRQRTTPGVWHKLPTSELKIQISVKFGA